MRKAAPSSLVRRLVRARFARLVAAGVLAVVAASAGLVPGSSMPASRADEVGISANNLRNGWDQSETTGALAPAVVKGTSDFNGGTFGQLFSTFVDGQVYAQPIVVGGTLIVATENDWVYGLNVTTGAVKWKASLGTPWPVQSGHLCNDLTPNIGVTGTPVYDAALGAVFMVSEQVLKGDTAHPVFFMDALDPATGQELPGWPVRIQRQVSNNPSVPFIALNQLQRPGLLLLGGSVYAAFGSHCDYQPYEGYILGVSTTDGSQQTLWSDEAGVTSTQAGIWQSGGGLMSDGAGRIFFASGNGISPAPGAGIKPPSQLAESVVRLAVLKDGSLAARDFFSPSNAPYLDSIDGDFGSGAPVGLPFGTTALPHLMVEAGKVDGLYVLNRDKLGGRSQGRGGSDAVVSEVGKRLPGQWGHPAVFADTPLLSTANVGKSRDYLYYVGQNDVMRYFKAGLGGSDGVTPVLTQVAQTSDKFGYTSGSPVVTSSATTASSGVVWEVNSSGSPGTTGTLQAFPVVPPGTCTVAKPCTVSPLWTSAPFHGAGKFTVPATDDGHVYIATRGVVSDGSSCGGIPSGDYCGQVLGFGSPASAPLTATPAPPSFGDVAVGSSSAAQQVTVVNTSSANVTIKAAPTATAGFAVAGPFDYTPAGQSPMTAAFPQVLHAGDSLVAENVTFDPSAPGGASGSLEFSTSSKNFPVFGVGLSGTGTQAGFYASSGTVDFGAGTPVGTTTQQQITVTNGESLPVTWTTTTSPGSPFSVTGLPADLTPINPGQSVPLTVTYQPAGTSGDSGSLTLTADDGSTQTPTTITLTGTGAADVSPTLTASPASLDFNSVALGHNAEKIITLTNSGNLPAVISVTRPPGIPFGAPDPIAGGLPVNPGYSIQIPVTFTPASIGAVSDSYRLTWTDVLGSHQIVVPVTGNGAAPAGVAVPPPGGGWSFNGSARMTRLSLSLNQVTRNQAGSAVYSVPVASGSGLTARFTATLNGGTGGNGITFALLDAAKSGLRAVGGKGSALGFGGLAGVAVTLNTSKDAPSYPSSSFVGLATSTAGGALHFVSTANVPGLRTGSHKVGVTVSGGKITVTVDGKQYLSRTMTLPPSVRLAFTGGTGVRDDNHLVSGVSITSGSHRIPAPGGGWSYNGAAGTSSSDTRLTRALTNQAGSVVYAVPVKAIGLRVTFDAQLGGGTGGDGLTFALLNPATTKTSTLGAPGAMLGLGTSAGVPGLGVVLATDGPASPAGFVATSVAVNSTSLRYQRKAQGIGMLTTGTHLVTVNVTKSSTGGAVVTVYLDQVQVLQEAEPSLTSTVRLAFTAGTGTTTDLHIVRNVAISASS